MNNQIADQCVVSAHHRPASPWAWEPIPTDLDAVELRREWREQLDASDDHFAMYQSPEWFDHMREVEGIASSSIFAATRHDEHGGLAAFVPLFVSSERCQFPLALGSCYQTHSIEMIKFKSGHLLVRPERESFNGLFDAIHRRYPKRPLKIENIPIHGPLYNYLQTSRPINERYLLSRVPGFGKVHVIPLPADYEQFLGKYSAKKRYNVRRQFRLLNERTGGKLNWREYSAVDDVPELHRCFAELNQKNNPVAASAAGPAVMHGFDCRYSSLARRELLQSFVLKDGDKPISCILGFHSGKKLFLGKITHDPEYDAFSPGVALLHLVIEDLISKNVVTSVNLGYGNPAYSHGATNVALDYASFWLFPRTFKNRSIRACYRTFKHSVSVLKGFKNRASLTTALDLRSATP